MTRGSRRRTPTFCAVVLPWRIRSNVELFDERGDLWIVTGPRVCALPCCALLEVRGDVEYTRLCGVVEPDRERLVAGVLDVLPWRTIRGEDVDDERL